MRKGGEQGEQSFVYMGFKGAALYLARGRAPRGSGPRCLQRRGLSGRHPEPCTRGIACPRAACLTCGWTSLPLGQRPPPEIPAPFVTYQDTGFFFCCFFFKPGRVCVFLACSSGPGSLFSDLGFISNPSSDRLVFINVFFPSINSHGYSLQLVMIKKCKEPPFNLTQSIAILTSVTQEGSDAGRGA